MTYAFFRAAAPAAFLTVLLAAATPVEAQRQQAQTATRQPAVEANTQPQAPQQTFSQNAVETRRAFYKVLDEYPPALGRVLRLDPTLMTNPTYLGSYPNIAAFIAQHPDVPRNPGYYLERYEGSNYYLSQPPDARAEALHMWRNAMEFFGAFAIFCVVVFAVFNLIKYIVEYRRWHRVSKVNAEVHNKILDRFGSNEELLAYIDSPAGRRFLEATPIAPSLSASRVGAPFGRILFSVQIGVLLLALAVGLMLIGDRAIEEVQHLLMGLAIVGLCLGVGCLVSAGASYVLSRKLGLLPSEPEVRPSQSV